MFTHAVRESVTNTLMKRAGSYHLYMRWGKARGMRTEDLSPFRFPVAHGYVKSLFDDGAPATRASKQDANC